MVVRAWANTRVVIRGKCRTARAQAPSVALETFVELLPASLATDVCSEHSSVVQREVGIEGTWEYCTLGSPNGKDIREHFLGRSLSKGVPQGAELAWQAATQSTY